MNTTADGIGAAIMTAKLAADAANPPQEGDYTVSGILYCGHCHTPKQCLAPNPFGEPFLVGIRCQCKKEIDRQAEEAKQREKNEDLRRRAFDTAGMHEKTFANSDKDSPTLITEAWNFAERIAGQDKTKWRGLLLFGEPDGGKTYAAAAVVNELTDRGIPCLMRTIISLANDLFAANDKNGYLNSLDRYRLLVLDDLKAEWSTPYMTAMTYQIIDYRMRSGLPMLITTNLTWDEIRNPKDVNGQRLYTRIMDVCHAIKVPSVGRRNQNAADQYKEMREALLQPIPETPPTTEPVHISHPPFLSKNIGESAVQQTPPQSEQPRARSEKTPLEGMNPGQFNDRRNAVLDALGGPRET